MRGRLRQKLLKRRTAAKLRAVASAFYEKMPQESGKDRMLKVRWAVWYTDMECYRQFGRPMFTGVAWVKTNDGPLVKWDRRKARQA